MKDIRHPVALALGLLLLGLLPFWAPNQYILFVCSTIGIYWILIAGLNLVVGYTGQLSIGHVGLLAVGAYAYSILTKTYEVAPLLACVYAAVAGAGAGFLLGLPSLRLPGFYFAMVTMAFTLVVHEVTLAQEGITGGGMGINPTPLPAPFNTPSGMYWLIFGTGLLVTLFTWNIARLMWGRGLVAIRDSEVAAASVGVPIYRAKLTVFVFSGFTAGLAGPAFALMQSYITPDTFGFDISLFFFIAIIIGGRNVILGPFIGTAVLTLLPELVGPLSKYASLMYGVILLLIVLLLPDGVAQLIRQVVQRFSPAKHHQDSIRPHPESLAEGLKGATWK